MITVKVKQQQTVRGSQGRMRIGLFNGRIKTELNVFFGCFEFWPCERNVMGINPEIERKFDVPPVDLARASSAIYAFNGKILLRDRGRSPVRGNVRATIFAD